MERAFGANRFGQEETVTNVPGTRVGGTMDAGGVAEISRWRKPPVTNPKCGEPWKGGGIRVAPFPFGFAQGLSLSNGHRPVRGWDSTLR